MPGLTFTLDFLKKELMFDPKNLMAALDQDILVFQAKVKEINKNHVNKILSLMEEITQQEEKE